MSELFSKGAHAHVLRVNYEVLQQYPDADLIREEQRGFQGPEESLRALLRLQIADALFPGRVIQAVAAYHTEEPLDIDPNFRNFMLSRRADVPIEHATFSAHIEKNMLGVRLCGCAECVGHVKEYHGDVTYGQVEKLAKEAQEWGIELPAGDPTDYCMTSSGEIIFFEVNKINPTKLRKRLEENPNKQMSERVLGLLDRYEVSVRMARHFSYIHHTGFFE